MLFRVNAISRFLFAVGLIFTLLFVGTIGFMIIEGYNFINALYMTVITISTVGYGYVDGVEISESGKIFIIFLIITSIGTFAFSISAITSYFIAGEYVKQYKSRKNLNRVRKMKNHVIVCGFGRVGQKVCEDLKSHNREFLVIESNEDKADLISEKHNYATILGDATSEDILHKANLSLAAVLITTLPNDAENVYTVLTARELNPGISIISRASQKASINKLRTAGANNVIMPDSVGGSHMASLVINPDVLEFLDHISVQGPTDDNLEEVCFKKSDSFPAFDDLKNSVIENDLELNIIGFKSETGEIVINPTENPKMNRNTKLFVLGKKTQIDKLNQIVGTDYL